MKYKFTVEGIDCPNCAAKLARTIEERDGIESCKINFLSEKMTVESSLEEKELIKLLAAECRAFSRDITLGK